MVNVYDVYCTQEKWKNAIYNWSLKVILIRKKKEPGLMARVLIPAIRKQKQVVLHEFKARMVYVPSSRPVKATQ